MSGGELARLFHADAVAPLLAQAMPRLGYAAGRLGSGSDVLGLDDAMSRDHDWGCRLGVDPTGELSVLDWLVLTGQSVLEVVAGPVFTDGTAELAPVRAALRWYPPDIERYALAAAWQRLSQEMPMVGRTAERGDEFGSRLLSARLAGDLMWLAFALSRRWPPYPKWRGTAFQALDVAAGLAGPLAEAATAPGWRGREDALAEACEVLLGAQRARGLPAPASAVTRFWDRPYRTVGQAVQRSLLAGVTDPGVTRLPPIGSIEQWVSSVDILASPGRRAALQAAYRACAGRG
jgi:hypothetical protein